MGYKGAIFDMDGLLLDTERIYQQIWQEIAGERGVKLDAGFVKAVSGTNGKHMCRVIESYYHVSNGAVIVDECMGRIRKRLSTHVPVKQGVHEILDFFHKKNIRIAVASSTATQQIESNLKIAGIRGYFTAVVSGAEVRRGKPEPDIFLLAADRIGCRPAECFVFEDSENGIRAGCTAGCTTVMIPDIVGASPEIRPYCTKICQTLSQARKEVEEMMVATRK